jgi:hypothetical protein
MLFAWSALFRTVKNTPEIVNIGEGLLFPLPNLFNNTDKAAGNAIFSPVNTNNIGVQIFTPPSSIGKLVSRVR